MKLLDYLLNGTMAEEEEDSSSATVTSVTPVPQVPDVLATSREAFQTTNQSPALRVGDQAILLHDPAAWKADFDRWRAEQCISLPGRDNSHCAGSFLLDFAEWCVAHDAVPCVRQTFEQLLRDAGFPIKDGLVQGLMPVVELEAQRAFQGAPGAFLMLEYNASANEPRSILLVGPPGHCRTDPALRTEKNERT